MRVFGQSPGRERLGSGRLSSHCDLHNGACPIQLVLSAAPPGRQMRRSPVRLAWHGVQGIESGCKAVRVAGVLVESAAEGKCKGFSNYRSSNIARVGKLNPGLLSFTADVSSRVDSVHLFCSCQRLWPCKLSMTLLEVEADANAGPSNGIELQQSRPAIFWGSIGKRVLFGSARGCRPSARATLC